MAKEFKVQSDELRNALAEPFGLEELEWRVQRSGFTKPREGEPAKPWAIVTPFVKVRAIQDRLDALVGPARWRTELAALPSGGMLAGLSIFLQMPDGTWQWVTKWDGTGHMEGGGERGLSTADAGKGEISTALKRAATAWGIARYLGRITETFAVFTSDGRYRSVIKGQNGQKQSFQWNPPPVPVWALPNQMQEDAAREQRANRAVANDARRRPNASP